MLDSSSIPVGFALGSNLGDRGQAIESAFAFLKGCGVNLHRSSIYETDPVDCPPGSPTFLNAAAELSYTGDLIALLDRCQDFERSQGRPDVRAKNVPRSVDIDLLYAGDVILNEPRLILPHPRMHLRAFVLKPLMDISPERVLPGSQLRVRDLWRELVQRGENQVCRKIA